MRLIGLRVWVQRAARWLGVEVAPVSHVERIVAGAGGFAAIALLLALERGLLGDAGAALLVASTGATAVLLFAVPHGALSQPWAVIGGHCVSALIGVTCAWAVPDATAGAGLAVGLAILAMHYLRAIHPPGGATALTAVVGGPQIHALGYSFVLMPVLANAVLMVLLAIALNAAFAWRRYPSAWGKAMPAPAPPRSEVTDLMHADFIAGLQHIGTFVDISEEEFLRLRDFMQGAAERRLKGKEPGEFSI